ncbi:hypothetical protein HAX54_041925 [Datura stramonium]|uniref:Uncharacterized protein n=1 Tax=Datura stramonium TaxID=4076 RepID=A0ABS8RS53_DATST|nr:hypothetical protein [Datura stramonium]
MEESSSSFKLSGKKKKSELAKLQKEHDEKMATINELEKKREKMKLQLANKETSEEKKEAFRILTEKYQSMKDEYDSLLGEKSKGKE